MNKKKIQQGQIGKFIVWPNSFCLLEELAKEIISLGKKKCADLHIVFPTQRLATLLIARLTDEWKYFYPPSIWTIESFITDHAKSLNCSALPIADDMFIEILLSHLIKNGEFAFLKQGDEHELKEFFFQIIETEQEDYIFADIRKILSQDVYHKEETLAALIARNNEIEILFKACVKQLSSYKLNFKDKVLMNYVKFLNKEIVACNFSVTNLYIVGFTTLKKFIIPLLSNLVKTSTTQIWLSDKPNIFSLYNPLAQLAKDIENNLEQKITKESFVDQPANIAINPCSDVIAEVKRALDVLENFIQAGAYPSQLALLVADENIYGDLLRLEIRKRSIKANIALSYALDKTEFGVWLCLLLKFIFEGNRAVDLLAFIQHPLTDLKSILKEQDYDTGSFNKITYNLFDFNLRSGLKNIEKHFSKLGLCDFYNYIIDKLSPILTLIDSTTESNLFHIWNEALTTVINNFLFVEKSGKIKQKDKFELYKNFMNSLSCIETMQMNANEIHNFILTKVLKTECRAIGYPLKGIQIISLIEARYVPFKVVAILGCVEGVFPKSLPQDTLIDDWLKRKLGLRGWKYVESLEDTTFNLIAERVPHIEIFYPQKLQDKQTIPSRFVERLRWEEKAVEINHEISTDIDNVAVNTNFKLTPSVNLDNPDKKNIFKSISASSVKKLFTCSYRYLYHSLGIRKWQGTENLDYLKEGIMLHSILEVFYTGRYKNKSILTQLAKSYPSANLKTYLLNRIKKVTDYIVDKRENSLLRYHLYEYSWPKFIDFIIQFYQSDDQGNSKLIFTDIKKEFVFSNKNKKIYIPYVFKNKEYYSEVFGTVDSIESIGSFSLIIDYKRKNPPAKFVGEFSDDPQLIFYAYILSLAQTDLKLLLERSLTAYWNIIEGKFYVKGAGCYLKENYFLNKYIKAKNNDLSLQVEQLQLALQQSIVKHLADDFKIIPKKSKECNLCELQKICQPALHVS